MSDVEDLKVIDAYCSAVDKMVAVTRCAAF